MGQVTIYLEKEVENKMKAAAKVSDLSVSKWIANLINEKITTEWPQNIISMAGSWKDDFPSLHEIRSTTAKDFDRETL